MQILGENANQMLELQKSQYQFPTKGLQNIGHTCYMSTSLQCLFHSQPLAKYLLQQPIEKLIKRSSKTSSQAKITIEFVSLLKKLIKNNSKQKRHLNSYYKNTSPFNSYDHQYQGCEQPTSFKNALSQIFSQYRGKNQQDSYGLCLNVMITLHQALNQIQSRKDIQKHFLLNKFSQDQALKKFKSEYFAAHSSIITELFSCVQIQRNTCNVCDFSYLYLDTHNIWKIPSHVFIKQKPSLEIMIVQNLINFELHKYQYEENKFKNFGQLCQQIAKNVFRTHFDQAVFTLTEIQKFKSGQFQSKSRTKSCQLVDEKDMEKSVRDMLEYMKGHRLSLTIRKLEKSEKKYFVPIKIRHSILEGIQKYDPCTPALIYYLDPNKSAYDFWDSVEKLKQQLKCKPQKKYNLNYYTIVQSKILNLNFQNSRDPPQHFSLTQNFIEIGQKQSQQIKMSQYLKSPQMAQFIILWNLSYTPWQAQFKLQTMIQKNHKPVPSKAKLTDCFKQYQKQISTGNQLYCERCDQVTDHRSHKKMYQTSNLLIIVLDRFKQTMHGCVKDDTIVEFDMQIDLAEIVQNPSVPSQKSSMHNKGSQKYSLYGVANHNGSLYSGHYYAYCRDIKQQKWYIFNDSMVSPISKKQVVNNKAYILFYKRNDLQQ